MGPENEVRPQNVGPENQVGTKNELVPGNKAGPETQVGSENPAGPGNRVGPESQVGPENNVGPRNRVESPYASVCIHMHSYASVTYPYTPMCLIGFIYASKW